jgi:hypothetical protein
MRVVEMLTAFVANATDGVLAARVGSDREESAQFRSAFKASVYFLITALASASQTLLQAEKDILKKGKVRASVELGRTKLSLLIATLTTACSLSLTR